MLALLPELDQLPRQNASHVKNKWADMVRRVHEEGSVAVTNHSAVEMVLVDAATYRQITESLQALKTREQTVLDTLSQRFDASLALLQKADAADKVAGLFQAGGKLLARPKAGHSF